LGHNGISFRAEEPFTVPAAEIEPLGKVRTKIVATLGPSCRDPAILRRMILAGVDVVRLNFSHGTHDEHSAALRTVREVAQSLGRVIGVLQDLGGPKIRLGPIPGDVVECRLGGAFTLVTDRTGDDPHELTCTYRELPIDLKPGDSVLFADGAVIMNVVASGPDRAMLAVTLPGRLKARQGINLPGTDLKIASLTEKDLADLEWTAKHDVDYVGLSFVRSADDVGRLRRELSARGSHAKIVAKIEKPQAVENLDAILAQTDAVMVARGDLGVEMDVAVVPAIQKRVIAACNRARLPVITATQMLNSMEQSSRPTRAEASDVFNAVLDGTDAVMLSGETAAGLYPVEAVSTMSRIVTEAEKLLTTCPFQPGPPTRVGWITAITESVVDAASQACRHLNAALLVVATHSGRTALALSKQRHATPTLAMTNDPSVARAMSLYWGVTPLFVPDISDFEGPITLALELARSQGFVSPGDRIVLMRGTVPGSAVHNALLVQEVT
jgi:pyruvate kinase